MKQILGTRCQTGSGVGLGGKSEPFLVGHGRVKAVRVQEAHDESQCEFVRPHTKVSWIWINGVSWHDRDQAVPGLQAKWTPGGRRRLGKACGGGLSVEVGASPRLCCPVTVWQIADRCPCRPGLRGEPRALVGGQRMLIRNAWAAHARQPNLKPPLAPRATYDIPYPSYTYC